MYIENPVMLRLAIPGFTARSIGLGAVFLLPQPGGLGLPLSLRIAQHLDARLTLQQISPVTGAWRDVLRLLPVESVVE